MSNSVIELVEQGTGSDGAFMVRVGFSDRGVAYDVTVIDPSSPTQEQLLSWYFEEHLRFPFLDGDKRREAVTVLRGYGQRLFAQVFTGEPGFEYQALRKRGFDGCRIEVVGSARLHQLHWEALFDPSLDAPLALRMPITRRVDEQSERFDIAGPWPTLNILVVTARPRGARDVGYRTISQPLVAAVRQTGVPVQVDLVRPGTWAGLRAHLDVARNEHGIGWYHLVHFDVHGAFVDHDELRAGSWADRDPYGKRETAAFAGRQGFLFFETSTAGVADPRTADEVALLLAEHRVPMAVLNACQSAMQTDSEAALAQQLAAAGVPMVVGMAYSVTVTSAALGMPVFYEQLARGAAPELALRVMRRQLFDTPDRQGHFDQTLPLQDWMLPVVFQRHTVTLALRDMAPAEIETFETREGLVGEPPEVTYGLFVGRDLDVLGIERLLLTAPWTVPGSVDTGLKSPV